MLVHASRLPNYGRGLIERLEPRARCSAAPQKARGRVITNIRETSVDDALAQQSEGKPWENNNARSKMLVT